MSPGLKTAGICAFQRLPFKQSARTNLELKPYRRTSAPVDLVIGRQSETTCFLLLLHGLISQQKVKQPVGAHCCVGQRSGVDKLRVEPTVKVMFLSRY